MIFPSSTLNETKLEHEGEQMNGKPSNRKKKPANTIATIDGVKLTAAELTAGLARQIEYKLMTFAYFIVGDLIAILENGGMPQEDAKLKAAEIVAGAMRRFRDSEAEKAKGQ